MPSKPIPLVPEPKFGRWFLGASRVQWSLHKSRGMTFFLILWSLKDAKGYKDGSGWRRKRFTTRWVFRDVFIKPNITNNFPGDSSGATIPPNMCGSPQTLEKLRFVLLDVLCHMYSPFSRFFLSALPRKRCRYADSLVPRLSEVSCRICVAVSSPRGRAHARRRPDLATHRGVEVSTQRQSCGYVWQRNPNSSVVVAIIYLSMGQ